MSAAVRPFCSVVLLGGIGGKVVGDRLGQGLLWSIVGAITLCLAENAVVSLGGWSRAVSVVLRRKVQGYSPPPPQQSALRASVFLTLAVPFGVGLAYIGGPLVAAVGEGDPATSLAFWCFVLAGLSFYTALSAARLALKSYYAAIVTVAVYTMALVAALVVMHSPPQWLVTWLRSDLGALNGGNPKTLTLLMDTDGFTSFGRSAVGVCALAVAMSVAFGVRAIALRAAGGSHGVSARVVGIGSLAVLIMAGNAAGSLLDVQDTSVASTYFRYDRFKGKTLDPPPSRVASWLDQSWPHSCTRNTLLGQSRNGIVEISLVCEGLAPNYSTVTLYYGRPRSALLRALKADIGTRRTVFLGQGVASSALLKGSPRPLMASIRAGCGCGRLVRMSRDE